MSDQKIIKRDDKLLKAERIIRMSQRGILIIAIILLILFIYEIKVENKKSEIAFCGIIISLFAASSRSLQLNHIDSIKLYRGKLNNP